MGKGESLEKKPIRIIIAFMLIGIFFFMSVVDSSNVVNLVSDVKSYFVEATKGNIAGTVTLNKFGENLDVGTSEEDIHSLGGTLIFLQSPETMTINSTNAGDTLLGGNATSVEVVGLNSNWSEISEIINLSGTTGVNTTNQFYRVYRMKVNGVGNYSSTNAGNIIAYSSVTNLAQNEIPAGEGQSKTTHYTVPLGKIAIITRISATVNTGKDVDIKLKVRENADVFTAPYGPVRTLRDVRGIAVPVSGNPRGNLIFQEKTDLWAVGVTTAGSTSKIEINYDMVVYDK